ncbi:cytochrome P450 2W1 isoform X2 [Equus asinus]|uniref:cytochrome P450 2W1 isoform X2 n=1 Tax=Equus asinus TaxID=9793 RepID=UPI0038F626FB
MALLLLGFLGLLGLLGLWGLLRTCARTPAPTPRWPPGPRPLPLIGNLHLLRVLQMDRSLMQLSEQYGPVFTVHLGLQKTVVLTGYEAVREALVGTGQELADRPPIAIFQLIQGGGGVFFSSGPRWRAARQFTVRTLHRLGVGRGPAANKVLQELRCLTVQLDGYGGRPFPLALLGWAPSNVTFTLLFGQRFDYRDPVFVALLGLIDEVMVLLGTPGLQLFNIYPWLGTLLQLHRPVLRKIEEVRAILRTLLEARRPSTPRRGPVQSYMDALIQEGQGKDPMGLFAEANMVACALDMVMAGTETTSATLQWAALLMGKHPNVQGRVQEELDRVLGPERLPRLEDQRSLPYTNAVLHEVQRFITLLPHVARCTAADTQLCGYQLPKGTPVVPLLSSVLLDKTQWATPRQFNPGHFLDADGRFVKPAAFLPFSAGTRGPAHQRLGGLGPVGTPMPPVLAPRFCPLRADPSPGGPGLTLRLPGGSPWGTQPLHSRRRPGSPTQPWKERAWSPQPVPQFPLQAAVSASGRAWPGRSCSCCSPASSRGTACCRRPASAPPPWTPRPRRPSPCGRRPRPCALCPGPGDADRGTSGLRWDKPPGLPLPSPRLPAWGALWMIEAGRTDGPSLPPHWVHSCGHPRLCIPGWAASSGYRRGAPGLILFF